VLCCGRLYLQNLDVDMNNNDRQSQRAHREKRVVVSASMNVIWLTVEVEQELQPHNREYDDRIDGACQQPGDTFLKIDAFVSLAESVQFWYSK